MKGNLSALQLDGLKEVATIGGAHAATAMSQILRKKVMISVPEVNVLDIEDVPQALGGPDLMVAALYFRVLGSAQGSMMMVFRLTDAYRLVDMLMGHPGGKTKSLDEFTQSALQEIGNIASAGYLIALGQMVKMNLVHSVPALATDMLQAVLDGVLIELAVDVEKAVVLENRFGVQGESVGGYFLYLPEKKSLDRILKGLGL
jgi:chemotaxis protein CheC